MLLSFLNRQDIRYEQNKSIKDMTSFKVGGSAELVIYPDTVEKTLALVTFFKENNTEYFVMGNGSNLLFSDKAYKIPIIKTDALLTMHRDNDCFVFGSGVKLASAANFALEEGYTGLEFAHGIPGSIGGAVYMNAGAYDGEMKQVVITTKYIDENGNLCTVEGENHEFSYRHSCFSKKKCIILETAVRLNLGDKAEIRAKMEDLMQRRKSKQPLNLPSAGSTFKRPKGAFAGQLIDECGLRGYQSGGAAVSQKHCGFVVNVDHASFEDVISVIRHVQSVVLDKTGYYLECEVEIVE